MNPQNKKQMRPRPTEGCKIKAAAAAAADDDDENVMNIYLLLHRAFLRFTKYFTPTNAPILYYILV